MKIEVNHISLNYKKEGKGNPLILLHGNGEDHHIFDKLSSKLKENFTVYSIDSRNHGESAKTSDYSYESMSEDISQLISILGLKNVSIIGFSDGAIIALLLSLSHDNIFDKIVLLGVNLKPSDFKKENLEYLKNEYKSTHDPLLKMMLEQPNLELNELKNINTPTLIVRAEDELFKDEIFEEIVQTMPNAKLEIMKGHDHASYVVNSDVLYPILNQFL